MKKKNLLHKLSSGKGFYITAALSFALIITAIGFVYSSSVRLIEDLDVPTTVKEEITAEVQKNKDDVADPRVTTTVAGTRESEEATTTTRTAEEETTVAEIMATEAVSETFSNASYVYPFGNEIGREFSLTPVYDETMEDWRIHKGIDFLGEKGSDVVAVGDGKVTKVIADTSWGYCIEVDHGDFTARYCGIQQGTCVGIDDVVSKGDIIGKLGDTPCESSQQSHLHFETLKEGEHIDPIRAMKK
ncbi:MAG: M23 family metallopeptidase [Clostridia bacterium]|nr:M23 family metallopeptidase [Clostridia bacterium]